MYVSESAFWARATVIGAGLSVTKFFKETHQTLIYKGKFMNISKRIN